MEIKDLESFMRFRTRRGEIDHALTRLYAVTLTHDPNTGDVNLPMANGIWDFVMKGSWNAGAGYEKQAIDRNIGTDEEPTR